MTAVLQEILSLLVGGITTLAQGVGTGLKSLVEAIFIDTTGTTPALSTFGGVVITFAAIALAIGLCRWVMMFVTSLGAKN